MSTTVVKTVVASAPYQDQKPGTSGLRKKTRVFMQKNYLENFVQATFNVLKAHAAEFTYPTCLVVGGDGRYYCQEAAQIIVRMAAANGVETVWVGQKAILSTPAVSAIVRTREEGRGQGAFILTASHNPGGLEEDFGIKYNGSNGGPAPEKLTNLIFAEACKIAEYYTVAVADTSAVPEVNLADCGKHVYAGPDFKTEVETIDSIKDYFALLEGQVFDFAAIKAFFTANKDFRVVMDAMHGVAGPYVVHCFREILGLDATQCEVLNAVTKEDFGQGHPDPNLTYAKELVDIMGLRKDGSVVEGHATKFDFGAAFDGDADRNMVLGKQFFVTPSDSVAVIAAYADEAIPFFKAGGGLKAVARSMPTSAALDCVAKAKGVVLAEVPTGWKYFGNLMDAKDIFKKKTAPQDYTPMICGEESFGTGSNHVREKDGLWAVLAWLSILAHVNAEAKAAGRGPVSVEQILLKHWAQYGRSYYCRYDYEGVETDAAKKVMAHVGALKPEAIPALGGIPCATIDSFTYEDPVDASISANQGLRVIFEDQSRFVLRLSGTGSSGATIRLYVERYSTGEEVAATLAKGCGTNAALPSTAKALEAIVAIALDQTKISAFTGRSEPSVIT